MRAFAAFVRLSRLKFLVGGFIGGALGTSIAFFEHGNISISAYALAQGTITCAHLMTQYANEYYDRESDALTTRTKFSGGSGVLVEGELPPRVALVASLVCLGGAGCGIVGLSLVGLHLAAFLGALCTFFAWAYSAPPLRLLGRGLGEVDTALVVAVLVPLCAFAAQTGSLDALAIAATLPGTAAMFAMMICVEVPDVVADTATGKCNLVVRVGLRSATTIGLFALVFTTVAAIVAVGAGAPPAYAVAEAVAIGPILWLAAALLRLRAGRQIANETLARRGVLVFAVVGVLGTFGFASAPHVR
jgi:1,4-dihydroxy-2-naphthoate octaprenyltransferase